MNCLGPEEHHRSLAFPVTRQFHPKPCMPSLCQDGRLTTDETRLCVREYFEDCILFRFRRLHFRNITSVTGSIPRSKTRKLLRFHIPHKMASLKNEKIQNVLTKSQKHLQSHKRLHHRVHSPRLTIMKWSTVQCVKIS